MNVIKKLAGQSLVYGLSSVVPRVLNYFLVVLHSRIFTQQEYGAITELYAYVAILLVILTLGLETGFFRFAGVVKKEQQPLLYGTLFWFLAGVVMLFFIGVVTSINPLSIKLAYTEQKHLLWLTAAIVSIDAHSAILFASLRWQNRPLLFSSIKVTSVLINVGVNLVCLLLFPLWNLYSPQIGVGYVLIANLLGSITAWIWAAIAVGIPAFKFSHTLLGAVLAYSFPLLLSGLGGTTNEFLDRFFIKWLTPAANPMAEVGIYGANVKIAVLLILMIQMFRYAAEPFFFSHSKMKENPQQLALVTGAFTLFSLFVATGIYLFLPLLQYLVGEDFRIGLPVVPILLLANIFYGFYFNTSFWFKLNNRTWFGLFFVILGVITTVGVNLWLTPRFSYMGAAWARVACYAIMSIVGVSVGQRYYPIPYPWKKIALGGVFTLISIFLATLITPKHLLLLLAYRSIFIIILAEALLRLENQSFMRLFNQIK